MGPKSVIILLVFAVSAVSACRKSGSPAPGTTVYAAGEWGNLRYNVAAYWVNGRLVSLTDTMHIALARSIYVSGNDVYVAGMIGARETSNADVAVYWKNGRVFPLTAANAGTIANSVVVANGNVYVAGVYGGAPVYWVNGQPNRLNGAHSAADLNSMAIAGNDVYVVGEDSALHPCFWKNGQPTELQGAWALPTAIAIVGNDVYIAGQQSDTITGKRRAVLWKNGALTSLTDGSQDVLVDAIAVDGADVYVCGNTQGASGYGSTIWKNGQLFPIGTGSSGTLYAWGIGTGNGVVYVGGNESAPGRTIAAYWSAGGIVELNKNPTQSSTVWGIFVK